MRHMGWIVDCISRTVYVFQGYGQVEQVKAYKFPIIKIFCLIKITKITNIDTIVIIVSAILLYISVMWVCARLRLELIHSFDWKYVILFYLDSPKARSNSPLLT